MKLIHCAYCGTEYTDDLPRCPLCGRTVDGAEQPQKPRQSGGKGGARLAPKPGKAKEDRIPQWMWAVACVILSVAVLIGLLYFLISMGYLGGKNKTQQSQEPQQQQQQVQEAPDWEPDPEAVPEQSEPEPEPEPEYIVCESLELSDSLIILTEEGQTAWLTVDRFPKECTESMTFRSTDESVVAVNQVGLIAGIASGEAEIVVVCGMVSEKCTVVCDFEPLKPEPEPDPETEPEPEPEPQPEPEPEFEPELSSVDFTLFRPGEETTLEVENAPENAYITFTSSDTDVVTVSGTGVVKAVGGGTATITVTVNDKKLTCVARCKFDSTTENNGGNQDDGPAYVGNLSLTHTDVSLFEYEESFKIKLVDEAGEAVTGLTWECTDIKVCLVESSGMVTAVGRGTATVSTTYDGKTYECVVRCNFE